MSIQQQTKLFMAEQIEAIMLAKYLEGCNRQCDPGQGFIIYWINTNAKAFSDNWWSKN